MGEEKIIGDVAQGEEAAAAPVSVSAAPEVEGENNGEHSHHHHSHHSHHSGSHRHGSHGRHRSRRKNIFSRLKRFFKKLNNKNRLSFICALALALILVFAVSLDLVMGIINARAEKEALENEGTSDPHDILTVELINGSGMLITEAVQRYLAVDLLAEHNKNVMIKNFVESGKRYDAQNPVALKLSTVGSVASAYKIELADNPRYENARVDYVDSSVETYVFEHLYANTKYYYRVTAYTAVGVAVENGSFTTSDTPRILSIDGLYNVRDIGNWMTDSGKRIKQGLLIRGTEMDGAVERNYHITNDGMSDMLDVFGIRFDMDLRSEAATPLGSDALGSRVTHKYYDMVMYSDIFTEEGMAKVKAAFTDLANPDNYPMYLHCTYGCDRTGTICYLLEALLGVSRGDCLRDYGLSNRPISQIIAVEEGLAVYGEYLTLKQQTENYLLACGVTMDEINSIREIFLGE